MFETYILPVLIFAGLGLLAGVLLTVVSKVFEVKTDERVSAVNDVLPQANCGACGFSGCSDYASAVVVNGVATNLCKAGGDECAKKIAEIMGTAAMDVVPQIAVVRCSGDCKVTKPKYDYGGDMSCKAAKRFYGGSGECIYGCIGLGDCVKVCQEGGISVTDGLAAVDPTKCIGCGLCAKVCPNNLIIVRNMGARYDVKCSSHDMGKAVKAVCSAGCIGCKICTKKCEFDAIHVEDNLAAIDYDKCTGCGKCADACPVKIIKLCTLSPKQ